MNHFHLIIEPVFGTHEDGHYSYNTPPLTRQENKDAKAFLKSKKAIKISLLLHNFKHKYKSDSQ